MRPSKRLMNMVMSIRPDPTVTREDVIEALADVVGQSCQVGDQLDSMALSAYADALHLLARLGMVKIEMVTGRRVIAHWTP